MRTKTLLCLAALTAAGVATSMAQSNVYSLNVVGYVNIPMAANQQVMIANQLNTTNNTIGSLIPNGPPGAQLFKYNGGYTAYAFDDVDLVWLPNGNATLAPGEGCFFKSPVATTLTFVGEVIQGSTTNILPINLQAMRSSIVPQQGKITTDLLLPGEAGDQLFRYAGGFSAFAFDDVDLVWLPSEPTINVGEAFFYKKASTSTNSKWIRNFTVQ